MNKETKKILIVAGITVFVVVGTYTAIKLYQRLNNPSDGDDKGKDEPKEDSKGKFASAKGDFVNVRKSPMVNDGIINNLLKRETENPVGVVLSEEVGLDGYTWYKLRLAKPVGNTNEGFVREDVVTLKK